jgi:hypothetical protein
VAGVNCYSNLMALSDLKDDGDYKLILADLKGRLKVYMGTNVVYNEKLADKPVAIETLYDSTKKPSNQFLPLRIIFSDPIYCCSCGKFNLLFLKFLASYEI